MNMQSNASGQGATAEHTSVSGGAFGNDAQSVLAALADITALLEQIAQNTAAGANVVLDTGAMVGQMLPAIDDGLGKVAARKGRGM